MAEVQPFRAWRYDLSQVGDLADVVAPPYDVINPDERDRLYERHPCNVIRLILNRPEPGDAAPEAIYPRAAQHLRRWQQDGVLLREHEDSLYVYHQVFDWEGVHFVRKGFLGRIRLEEFGQGCVYPHEQTLSGPKADRLLLTKACRANLSPIFGLYPDEDGAAQEALERRIATLTPLEAQDDLGVLHRLWPVSDPGTIDAVRSALADRPIFIADGHHRYETACNYRRWLAEQGQLPSATAAANFVLMMFVAMSDPGLAILPTHRLVSGFAGLAADGVRAALGPGFAVEDVGTGAAGGAAAWELMQADGGQDVFGLGTAADGRWLFVRVLDPAPMKDLEPERSDDWRGLGVSLLHRYVIDRQLKGAQPQAAPAFRYVHRLDEVTTSLAAGDCDLGCLVPPAKIEHVERIAARLEKMPPKSTYFYPKLLSGLVIHPLE